MRSSQARTQVASESAARIGGTDKSINQLDDEGERGRSSGRKRQRQPQHDNGGDQVCPSAAPRRQTAKSRVGYHGNTSPQIGTLPSGR